VRAGAASRSYGIQVAQRAGIPAAVIRHATRMLARLEASGAPSPQLDLFSGQMPEDVDEVAAAARAVHDELLRLNPDELSPRAALEVLYQLHRQAVQAK